MRDYRLEIDADPRFQRNIEGAQTGDRVTFEHDDFDHSDPNSVSVRDMRRQRLGYLRPDHWLAAMVRSGDFPIEARIIEIAGGTHTRPLRTIALAISVQDEVRNAPAVSHHLPTSTHQTIKGKLISILWGKPPEYRRAQQEWERRQQRPPPNSFQSCMGCLGIACLILLGLLATAWLNPQ